MLKKTDARNVVTSTNYDALGRPTQISYSDSTPTAGYTYDTGTYGIGRLYETSNANATTTYFYNQKGHVTGIDKTIGAQNFAISYTRNYVGAALTTMLPNGTTISYTRDRAQRLTGVTSDWVDSNHPATLATNFVYNAAGAVTSVEYGNGTLSTRSFNTGMQLKTLEYGTTADPDAFLDFEYDYDEGASNTGQIMQITDHIDTTKTISYTYDNFYRLKTAETSGSHWGLSWTYDRYGNRLAQSVTKGLTAPQNTLSVSTSTNRVSTWSYDGAGNVTNDGEYTYTFDANNMIKDVDAGSTAVYKYDVNGRRVMKTIESETIYYVFGVGQYSSVSGWDKVYVHLGRQKLLEYSNGMTYFYGTDHLATPRVQTNISATVTETWSSYPYGEEWLQTGPDTEENRFTGHLRDAETELHYAGSRFLDDKSRWLSVDPMLGDSSNPQRLNRFSYTLSDPVNYLDSSGGSEERPTYCPEEARYLWNSNPFLEGDFKGRCGDTGYFEPRSDGQRGQGGGAGRGGKAGQGRILTPDESGRELADSKAMEPDCNKFLTDVLDRIADTRGLSAEDRVNFGWNLDRLLFAVKHANLAVAAEGSEAREFFDQNPDVDARVFGDDLTTIYFRSVGHMQLPSLFLHEAFHTSILLGENSGGFSLTDPELAAAIGNPGLDQDAASKVFSDAINTACK